MEKYSEFDFHLMNDEKPSSYFNESDKNDLFKKIYPYTLIGELKNIPQSPQYHPEGNVWNHTMLVVDNAAQRKAASKNPKVFMWSALLHDLGKTPTTRIRRGKITSYDHDIIGEKLSMEFLKVFTMDMEFIDQVAKMVRWHMQILHVVKGLPYANIDKMVSEVSINEIALLGLCDRLGRGGITKEKEQEEIENIDLFIKKCNEFLQNSPLHV